MSISDVIFELPCISLITEMRVHSYMRYFRSL